MLGRNNQRLIGENHFKELTLKSIFFQKRRSPFYWERFLVSHLSKDRMERPFSYSYTFVSLHAQGNFKPAVRRRRLVRQHSVYFLLHQSRRKKSSLHLFCVEIHNLTTVKTSFLSLSVYNLGVRSLSANVLF